MPADSRDEPRTFARNAVLFLPVRPGLRRDTACISRERGWGKMGENGGVPWPGAYGRACGASLGPRPGPHSTASCSPREGRPAGSRRHVRPGSFRSASPRDLPACPRGLSLDLGHMSKGRRGPWETEGAVQGDSAAGGCPPPVSVASGPMTAPVSSPRRRAHPAVRAGELDLDGARHLVL